MMPLHSRVNLLLTVRNKIMAIMAFPTVRRGISYSQTNSVSASVRIKRSRTRMHTGTTVAHQQSQKLTVGKFHNDHNHKASDFVILTTVQLLEY